jgi:hypothetical protein
VVGSTSNCWHRGEREGERCTLVVGWVVGWMAGWMAGMMDGRTFWLALALLVH